MLKLARRTLLASPLLSLPAYAQGFPERSIRLIIPWPAGASADIFLRTEADLAGKRLGQPVVPENRPGASATLGAVLLKDAKPDGYTLAQIHSGVVRAQLMADKPSYDALADFTYIIQLAGSGFGIVVRADAPWQTLADLLAEAKRRPGALNYGTPGVASTHNITMLDIQRRTGTELTHIPYNGAGPLYTALMGGQVDVVADASGWASLVKEGRFRLLAVWGGKRMPEFPAVPTLQESGIDLVVESPYGIAGPRGMDPAVVAKLHDAFKEAVFDPAAQAIIARYGMLFLYGPSAGYEATTRAVYAEEQANLRRLGLLGSVK